MGVIISPKSFLDYLAKLEFTCSVDAIAEGTPVFAHEPLLRVKGPLIQCQLLETALLNIINFQTLIATKAARISHATHGDSVLEFGLRRAQGIDGSLSASRAAFVGGCAATSNVLAGKMFGIPVKGTHAHSWVMSFDDEITAFESYAEAMPNNCVFLVDTYDTLRGVKRAIEVGKKLKSKGYKMLGVRLDSGDLAWLSIEARKMLDDAGFSESVIVASNDLDERTIESLKHQGAKIAVWGVGTKLVTAYDQPALGGVYKLSSLRKKDGEWKHKIKLSEQAVKTSTPGHLQVRRFRQGEEYVGDMIFDEQTEESDAIIVDPNDASRRKLLNKNVNFNELLEPVFREGKCVRDSESLSAAQQRCITELSRFHNGIKRFDNPHEYPVGLGASLFELKHKMIREAREEKNNEMD